MKIVPQKGLKNSPTAVDLDQEKRGFNENLGPINKQIDDSLEKKPLNNEELASFITNSTGILRCINEIATALNNFVKSREFTYITFNTLLRLNERDEKKFIHRVQSYAWSNIIVPLPQLESLNNLSPDHIYIQITRDKRIFIYHKAEHTSYFRKTEIPPNFPYFRILLDTKPSFLSRKVIFSILKRFKIENFNFINNYKSYREYVIKTIEGALTNKLNINQHIEEENKLIEVYPPKIIFDWIDYFNLKINNTNNNEKELSLTLLDSNQIIMKNIFDKINEEIINLCNIVTSPSYQYLWLTLKNMLNSCEFIFPAIPSFYSQYTQKNIQILPQLILLFMELKKYWDELDKAVPSYNKEKHRLDKEKKGFEDVCAIMKWITLNNVDVHVGDLLELVIKSFQDLANRVNASHFLFSHSLKKIEKPNSNTTLKKVKKESSKDNVNPLTTNPNKDELRAKLQKILGFNILLVKKFPLENNLKAKTIYLRLNKENKLEYIVLGRASNNVNNKNVYQGMIDHVKYKKNNLSEAEFNYLKKKCSNLKNDQAVPVYQSSMRQNLQAILAKDGKIKQVDNIQDRVFKTNEFKEEIQKNWHVLINHRKFAPQKKEFIIFYAIKICLSTLFNPKLPTTADLLLSELKKVIISNFYVQFDQASTISEKRKVLLSLREKHNSYTSDYEVLSFPRNAFFDGKTSSIDTINKKIETYTPMSKLEQTRHI